MDWGNGGPIQCQCFRQRSWLWNRVIECLNCIGIQSCNYDPPSNSYSTILCSMYYCISTVSMAKSAFPFLIKIIYVFRIWRFSRNWYFILFPINLRFAVYSKALPIPKRILICSLPCLPINTHEKRIQQAILSAIYIFS